MKKQGRVLTHAMKHYEKLLQNRAFRNRLKAIRTADKGFKDNFYIASKKSQATARKSANRSWGWRKKNA